MQKKALLTLAAIFCAVPFSSIYAQDMLPQPGDIKVAAQSFSPYAGREFPTKVLWGDTHLHTAISVDAGTMNRIGQEDA
jgi:hypothetical protein